MNHIIFNIVVNSRSRKFIYKKYINKLNMVDKRGQITLFIIVAIVIAILVGVTLYINYSSKSPEAEPERFLTPEQQSLNTYVKGCLEEVSRNGIYTAGLNSGYINALGDQKYGEPGDGRVMEIHYYSEYGSALSYVYDGDNVLFREKQDIERIISNYILAEINNCLDFSMFEEQGFSVVKPSHINATTRINDDNVFVELKYPVQLLRGADVVMLEDFAVKLNIRLGTIHDKVKSFINTIKGKNSYNIFNECSKYASRDKLLNIYVSDNPIFWDYAVTFVDAKPLEEAKLPFRFVIGVKNVKIEGDCAG